MGKNKGIIEEEMNLETIDATDDYVERLSRGYILGTKKLQNRQEIQDELETAVVSRVGKKGKMITDKLFELIEGVYVVNKLDKKGVAYYKVPPNLQAIIYALDRVLGKPEVQTKHTEEKRGLLTVEHIIKNLAKPKPAQVIEIDSKKVVEVPDED